MEPLPGLWQLKDDIVLLILFFGWALVWVAIQGGSVFLFEIENVEPEGTLVCKKEICD